MSFDGKETGREGEERAARFLIGQGMKILERNFETVAGEIDLVAEDGDTLVFVEVKAFRRAGWAEGPAVNVTREKKRRMVRAARGYLAKTGRERFCRFDVVTVWPGDNLPVRHFPGAFSVDGW
jgi:putative endonuclease